MIAFNHHFVEELLHLNFFLIKINTLMLTFLPGTFLAIMLVVNDNNHI